jgi:hypothetical protein
MLASTGRPPSGFVFVSPLAAVRALCGHSICGVRLLSRAFPSVGWYGEVVAGLAGLAQVLGGTNWGVRRRGWRSLRDGLSRVCRVLEAFLRLPRCDGRHGAQGDPATRLGNC